MPPFFVNLGEDQRFLIKALLVVVCILSLITMFLAYFTVNQRVIYINPGQVIGTAAVGAVPDGAVGYFAMTFLFFMGNANNISAEEQMKSAYLLMTPQLQSARTTELKENVDQIKQGDMVIQTVPLSYKVRNNRNDYDVDIDVVRMSFVYGQPVKKERRLYTLTCQKAATRNTNPFGMEVVSYDYKVLSSGDAINAPAPQK